MGAFDYLLKPVSIDELLFKIEDADRRRSLRQKQADASSTDSLEKKPG